MSALFVLHPRHVAPDAWRLAASSELQAAVDKLRMREYPPSDSGAELLHHVLTVRDPIAVAGHGRMARALLTSTLLGGLGGAAMAAAFGTHDGDIEAGARFGAGGGAAFGTLLASLRHEYHPAREIEALLPHVTPGDVLVSWSGRDRDSLRALAAINARLGMATALRA